MIVYRFNRVFNSLFALLFLIAQVKRRRTVSPFVDIKEKNVDTIPESVVVTTPTEVLVNSLIIQHSKWYYTYRSVPAEHIYEKVIDKCSPADYEIPVVTTDISVIPCPAYATTTFTETKEKSH